VPNKKPSPKGGGFLFGASARGRRTPSSTKAPGALLNERSEPEGRIAWSIIAPAKTTFTATLWLAAT